MSVTAHSTAPSARFVLHCPVVGTPPALPVVRT